MDLLFGLQLRRAILAAEVERLFLQSPFILFKALTLVLFRGLKTAILAFPTIM